MSTYDPLNNPLIAEAMEGLKSQTVADTSQSGPSLGWADNIKNGQDASELLKRADVLADIRAFYEEREGKTLGDDDDVIDTIFLS